MELDSRSERAIKRRFAILTLLHSDSHTRASIVTYLKQETLLDPYLLDDSVEANNQLLYQFRRDIAALRKMGCKIIYDKRSKKFSWHNSPFGLKLTQPQLVVFGTLFNSFENSSVLYAETIKALLNHLLGLLPQEQRKFLTSQRHTFIIDLAEATDYRNADPTMLSRINMAIERRQQLEFLYTSPRDGKERKHLIEPEPMVYDEGHVYLPAWSTDWSQKFRFRLDYIDPKSVCLLPKKAENIRPQPISYQLKYRLNPIIARKGVSQRFPGQTVETYPDGSAIVTAQITDLFEARRMLLSYADNCVILEPPKLVAIMRDISAKLYKIYHSTEE